MGARDETKTELQAALTNPRQGAVQKYMDLAVGRRSWGAFLSYEFLTFFAAPMPGAFGYALRSVLYRRWLGHVGRGVVFGRNVVALMAGIAFIICSMASTAPVRSVMCRE